MPMHFTVLLDSTDQKGLYPEDQKKGKSLLGSRDRVSSGGVVSPVLVEHNVPIRPETTAKEVCDSFRVPEDILESGDMSNPLSVLEPLLGLFLVKKEGTFERRVEDNAMISQVLTSLEESGRLDDFDFVMRDTRSRDLSKSMLHETESEEEDEGHFFSHLEEIHGIRCGKCGYLDKLVLIRDRLDWRPKWFVLQDDRLYWFRSHLDFNARSFVSLSDCSVYLVTKSPFECKEYVFGGGIEFSHFEREENGFELEIDTMLTKIRLRGGSRDEVLDWVSQMQGKSVCEHENREFIDLQTAIDGFERPKAEIEEKQSISAIVESVPKKVIVNDPIACRKVISRFRRSIFSNAPNVSL